MNNKQEIKDFIQKHNLNQTEAGELLGIRRNTLSRYLSDNSPIAAPDTVYINIRLYDRIKELELRLSKIDNLDEMIKKYDKIKALIDEVGK